MYSTQLLDHFQHPRNAGALAGAGGVGRARNPGCGDEVELSVRLEGGRVAEVRFRAGGCVAAVACASFTTVAARGLPVEEALRLDRATLESGLGGLPPTAGHAAQLALEALRAALRQAAGAAGR